MLEVAMASINSWTKTPLQISVYKLQSLLTNVSINL